MLLVMIVSFGVWGQGEVLASGFHVSEIGGITTNGVQSGHWWNTNLRPTFRGEALPGAEVSLTIDGTAIVINADSSGNWAYQPEAALSSGDHLIVIASNGSTVNFTLTLGTENIDWETVDKGSSDTLPTVGTSWPTVLISLVGVMMLGWGGKMLLNAR